MLLRTLLALPLLAAALPATAQTKLAQQCAAFGEAQYRKLSPSVDRVTALDFPPPALERVDAKVGAQAIAAALTLRGRLTYRSGSPFATQFLPCDGAPLPLEDRTPDQELTQALRGLTAGQNGRPMFVEIYGGRETGPGSGISALELRRAAVETAGCRERFDQREWLANGGGGNEPSWRLEVTSRDMMLSVAGGQPSQRIAHGGPQKLGRAGTYAAADHPALTVMIDERRCVDPQSGSLFAYTVEVRSEGKAFVGCAVHNPAMPAP